MQTLPNAKRGRTKTAILTLRVEPRIKAAAELAAEMEHRSLTAMIEVLILAHCKSHNIAVPSEDGEQPKK